MKTNPPLKNELALTPIGDGPDAVHAKLTDALTPGYQAEFDPDEAKQAGAFHEDALGEVDALASSEDLAAALDEPAFLDDGPPAELPSHVTVANARELFGLRPGETLIEVIARPVDQRR